MSFAVHYFIINVDSNPGLTVNIIKAPSKKAKLNKKMM